MHGQQNVKIRLGNVTLNEGINWKIYQRKCCVPTYADF